MDDSRVKVGRCAICCCRVFAHNVENTGYKHLCEECVLEVEDMGLDPEELDPAMAGSYTGVNG